MEFIRSVLVQDETPLADGTLTFDLPVNPLSHINLTLKALNVTDEAALADLLALITNVQVLHLGQAIIGMSAADLYALNVALLGRVPVLTNLVATGDATRFLGLVIPLGRKIMTPGECFPASKAGEFQLQLTVDIATAEAAGLILQVETTEMLGATPARHLKATTLAATPSAAGDMDVDIPIGNPLAGILLWGTTKPTSTAWTATIEQARLLADNRERGYANANWESMHADLTNRCPVLVGDEDAWTDDCVAHYALMDYDPRVDDEFLLETAGLSSLKLRINAGDDNPLRVIPLELHAARR